MLAHERTFINIPYKRDTFSKWNFTDANKRVVFLFPWFFVFIKALSKRNSWFPYSKESTGNKREKMSIYIEEDKFRDWNRYKKTKNVLIYLSNDIIYVIIFFHKFNFTECPAYAKSILYVVYYIFKLRGNNFCTINFNSTFRIIYWNQRLRIRDGHTMVIGATWSSKYNFNRKLERLHTNMKNEIPCQIFLTDITINCNHSHFLTDLLAFTQKFI